MNTTEKVGFGAVVFVVAVVIIARLSYVGIFGSTMEADTALVTSGQYQNAFELYEARGILKSQYYAWCLSVVVLAGSASSFAVYLSCHVKHICTAIRNNKGKIIDVYCMFVCGVVVAMGVASAVLAFS